MFKIILRKGDIKSNKPCVICMTLFWLDGYDPNTSTKGNWKGAWAGTRTFSMLYDVQECIVYYVDSALFATGPGKGSSKENQTVIFDKMLEDIKLLQNIDGCPKPFNLISNIHSMKPTGFYIC